MNGHPNTCMPHHFHKSMACVITYDEVILGEIVVDSPTHGRHLGLRGGQSGFSWYRDPIFTICLPSGAFHQFHFQPSLELVISKRNETQKIIRSGDSSHSIGYAMHCEENEVECWFLRDGVLPGFDRSGQIG